jgi:DNA-binding transcriptional LysR family regulator
MPIPWLRIIRMQQRTARTRPHAMPRPVRRSEPDWSDLQFFAAVCGAGSVSGAAGRIGVDHSTVLRRIAALERTLGATLFERRAGHYVLSPAGARLQAGLAGVGERIDAARAQVGGREDEVRGEIRLTSTDTLVHGLLMPMIEAFCTRHPGVRLQVVVNNHFLSLTRREADVAIRGSNRPPENLVGRHVGDIRTAPYASRAYLKSQGRGRPLAALDWVAPDESLAHLEQSKWLARHVAPERVAMTVDSLVGMVHAVEQGVGAAMLLCPLADVRPGLVRLAEPEAALNTQLWILTHPDLRQVARIRAFSQFMFEALVADPRLAH